MSDVDEGLIHAWLDEQLPADEAARVQHLVDTDTAWAAAAAEARGFIAASARVLGALDDVPSVRAVDIPARTAPAALLVPRIPSRPWWRAPWIGVAAVLAVAVGVGRVAMQQQSPQQIVAEVSQPAAPSAGAETSPPKARGAASAATAAQSAASDVPARGRGPGAAANSAASLRDDAGLKTMSGARQIPIVPESLKAAPPTVAPPERDVRADAAKKEVAKTDSMTARGGGGRSAQDFRTQAAGAGPVSASAPVSPLPATAKGLIASRPDAAGASAALEIARQALAPLPANLRNTCWSSLEAARAKSAIGGAADQIALQSYVLRFRDAAATDAEQRVPPASRFANERALQPAPRDARVQYVAPNRLNDSTYIADWVVGNGRVQLTFMVRGDTLDGSTVAIGDRVAPAQTLTAVRVACPR